MRDTANQEGSGSTPQQDYAKFLQRQAREAGLDAREISERFARAAKEQEGQGATAGKGRGRSTRSTTWPTPSRILIAY